MTTSGIAPSRRSIVAGSSLSALASLVAAPASAQAAPGKTFVFAHGSWHGGWSWQRVADRLRAQGHKAFAPSFTGMGDREHLLSKDITIHTFVQDLAEVIETEELTDVILVGHSFGGVPITGVADRMPGKLRHLVYLDAIVLENGQTGFSVYPPKQGDRIWSSRYSSAVIARSESDEATQSSAGDLGCFAPLAMTAERHRPAKFPNAMALPPKEAADRIAAADKVNGGVAVPIPKTLPAAWGFKEGTPDYAWVLRRITPTPLNAYLTALDLHAPVGNGVPKTYVHCTRPENPVIEGSRVVVRSQPNWYWIDFPGPHDVMITDPDSIVNLLLQILPSYSRRRHTTEWR